MLALALFALTHVALPHTSTFEISSNKPFIQATIEGSAPQWFILDTGCSFTSIIARECADRLQLQRGAEQKTQVGAGTGVELGLSTASRPLTLWALGDTMTMAQPQVLPLGHVSPVEGRRLDGLLGGDFLAKHTVVIDYAARTITLRDTAFFKAPAGAVVVPITLDTGWPVVQGTITARGGKPIPCRLIIDTGVRNVVTLFRPFSTRHGLYEGTGNLPNTVIGKGMGGFSRGDVTRLDALALGTRSFERPVAVFSRDTSGIFALDGPDGIVGGELLRRHRVTFDYTHGRMILEPYAESAAFEFDMSGLFLATDAPDFAKIRIVSVRPQTPGADALLQVNDEIVGIDGRRTPELKLDEARALFRAPGARVLEIRRGERVMQVRLEAKRLI